jgi:putative membrane protein
VLIKFAAALAILAAGAFPLAAQDAKLTDPQIAEIATIANDIGPLAAQWALKKIRSGAVRKFADHIEREHKDRSFKAGEMLKETGINPERNATSSYLIANSTDKIEAFEKLSGPAYEKAYIANEAAFNRVIGDALRDTLIPSAGNRQLRDFLQTELAMFESDRQRAERLSRDLGRTVTLLRKKPKPG